MKPDDLNPDRASTAMDRPALVDPQLRPFVLELMRSQARGETAGDATLDEVRSRAELVRARWRRGGPTMAAVDDLEVPTSHGGVRVRRFRPNTAGTTQPALVYLHGGGWTMFSLDTHDRIMRELAARADATIIGVDYALSPESKFPFALHQIHGVVHWLARHGGQWGIDARRMAIGGDSSGANLAVGTSLMLRDSGAPDIVRGMLLVYGCFSGDLSALPANGYGSEGNLLTSREMETFWRNYLADPKDAGNPLASPMLARLDGLPPAFQVIAQCDVLAEQDREFAARLRAAGVPVEVREYAGATHSFLEAVSIAEIAGCALQESAEWLRRCLRMPPGDDRPLPRKP